MQGSARTLGGLTALTAGVLLLLAGCDGQLTVNTVSRSAGSASFGSREVKFSLDGSGGVIAKGDIAKVAFAKGEVVVEKQRILLDDKEVAKVPDDSKVITVDYTAGMLTISADGNILYETRRSE